jgi:hypothetical protein
MKESYRENLASSSGHEPYAGSSNVPGVAFAYPKPPLKGGPSSGNLLVLDLGTVSKSPESEGLRPRVAYYG